jgi:tetratricopeptide (TPR) repeat protein
LPLQAEGEFALVNEELESALELSGQPVKRGTMAHEHIIYMMLTESAAQLRDGDGLRRYASQLETLAEQDDHRPYRAVAHRAWGIAHRLDNDYDEADRRLSLALELYSELDTPWQIGRTLCEMAELELARSDGATAHDHLSRALMNFEEIQALPDMKRTRMALEELDKKDQPSA